MGPTKSSQIDLPPGLTWRPATTDDAERVTDLIGECELVADGEREIDLEDIRSEWQRPSLDLSRDSMLVFDGERLVGWAMVFRTRAEGDVHPDFIGRGIGTALLGWTERRALEVEGGRPVRVGQTVSENYRTAIALLTEAGYRPRWTSWMLEIRHDDLPPAPPELPPGIEIRQYRPGAEEREIHALIEEAFGEWEDRQPSRYEDWLATTIGREDFEPWCLPVAVDGDLIVGTEFMIPYSFGGWVQQLAVGRTHRGRGLGRALLQHAFGEFYRRGKPQVGLSTDSRTGALGLYEHVGMKVKRSYTNFAKEASASD
jgi:mycothiol synthase